MSIQDIGFQVVTDNVAESLEEKVRVLVDVAPSWNFAVIFSTVLLLVLVKQFAPKRLKLISSMLYQSYDIERATREWNILSSFSSFTIAVSYVALLSLFIQKSILIFNGNNILYDDSNFYLEVCVFISAFILVRYLFINIVGWLFNTQAASQHHAVAYLSMAVPTNFILIVLLLIMSFNPMRFFVIIGFVVFIILTCIRLVKTFAEIQLLIKCDILKNFLYFCTLEIIPLSIAITMMFRFIVTDSVL